MNTAIIAEYNPFHNGHGLHIKETRRLTGCENIIVIMSGNFTQRGEPALLEKHIRARHALMNGADMVLELPVEYAAGAADVFAGAAVEILDKSGIADMLSFGSEQGSVEELESIADIFAEESHEFKAYFSELSAQGLSYPAARGRAAAMVLGRDISYINAPNNILAIEYLTALKRQKSKIRPFTVRRSNDYNALSLSGEVSSAAAIRESLKNGVLPSEAVPESVSADLPVGSLPDIDAYTDIFAYLLRIIPAERLAEIADMTEGLENRFVKFSHMGSITEMTEAAKTKRYTYTKLKRAVLHTVLGITKQMQQKRPAYIRVLGVRNEKKTLINDLAEKSALPVITRVKENEKLLETEIRAADIYRLLTDRERGTEYKNGMVTV